MASNAVNAAASSVVNAAASVATALFGRGDAPGEAVPDATQRERLNESAVDEYYQFRLQDASIGEVCELLVAAIRERAYSNAEHIIRHGFLHSETDEADMLWTEAAQHPGDDYLWLLYRRRWLPTEAGFRRLATAAAEANNSVRVERLVQFATRPLQSERHLRNLELRLQHGLDDDDPDAWLHDDDAEKAGAWERMLSIFHPAAEAACRLGNVAVLVTLSHQEWFGELTEGLIQAAMAPPPPRMPVLQFLLEHGASASAINWALLDNSQIAKLVPRINYASLPALPPHIRERVEAFRARLVQPVRRARSVLDRPPSVPLGTSTPTRQQLTEHLRSGGKRFAREYWPEGIPIFFPQLQEALGPVPDEFKERGGPPA